MNRFPKVLIIGHCPNEFSGAGITLRNLFQFWPKDRLSFAIDSSQCCLSDFDFGNNVFRFSETEKKSLFSKLVLKKKIIGKMAVEKTYNSSSKLFTLIKFFFKVTGLYHIRFKYIISEKFSEWVVQQDPDLIYSALGELNISHFVAKLGSNYNYPIVLHIWDDWPNTIYKDNVFSIYWRLRYDFVFKHLLSIAKLRLSISESMSKYYEQKYGLQFVPFHNPINVQLWNQKNDLSHTSDIIKIIYVGKINRETITGLLDMGNALNFLSKKINVQVTFEVYSPDRGKAYSGKLRRYSSIKLMKSVSNNEMPSLLHNANILFLPLGFTKRSVEYAKFSFPTKLSEYMMSGTPILMQISTKISLYKFAQKTNFFNLVSTRKIGMLVNAIDDIISNKSNCYEKANKARLYAMEKFSDKVVCENFRKELSAQFEPKIEH